MLASGIVVFREMLEVVLIVGLIIAATKGLAKRNLLVVSGVALGVLGSVMVAVFSDAISNMAEGVGQEIFNAAIMFTAVIVISWTVIWMSKHGRELAQKAKELGNAVISGEKPLYTVALVIALSVLREGTEMVLFVYGTLISGVSTIPEVIAGSAIGAATGVAVGLLFYFGMLKVAKRRLFQVTSWMLVILAAGMAAQGAKYLIAADLLPSIVPQVWDTSWLLSENSMVGQAIGSLIGYSAQPSAMQIIFFAVTFAIVGSLLANRRKQAVVKVVQPV